MAEEVSDEEIRRETIKEIKEDIADDLLASEIVSEDIANQLVNKVVDNYLAQNYGGGLSIPVIRDAPQRLEKRIKIATGIKESLPYGEEQYNNLMKTKIDVRGKQIKIRKAIEYVGGAKGVRDSHLIEIYLNVAKVLGMSDSLLSDIKQNVTKAYLKKRAESKT